MVSENKIKDETEIHNQVKGNDEEKDQKSKNVGAVRGRPKQDYSPDINIIRDAIPLYQGFINFLAAERGGELKVLDVGGRYGERQYLAEGHNYKILELEAETEDSVVGDICSCPHIEDDSFDVVMSFDLLEHVTEPWNATKEMARICRPGGLQIHATLFAYRYHPFPVDYWRYTSQGLEFLFLRTGCITTLEKGYDTSIRRWDARGIPLPEKKDVPPIDEMGGWRENWRTIFIGRKNSK